MSTLVRIVTLPDPFRAIYDHHRHEGMIICREHLDEIALDDDPTCVELPAAEVEFMGHRCLMCNVPASPGKRCANEDCDRALHPQWPAVYCCNRCAMLDA